MTRSPTADGTDHTATCIGSLPVWAYDSKGAVRTVIIPNVRCVPFFTDTLISVDELWQLRRFDIRFKDIREIRPYKPDGTIAFSFPFSSSGAGSSSGISRS